MQANAEISHKVRLAIKTKLTELGAYVDDELPDYVLVMVANRRGRQDMKKELELFLGDATDRFCSWLFDVLDKIKDAKKTAQEKRPSESEKSEPDGKENLDDYDEEELEKVKKKSETKSSKKSSTKDENSKSEKKSAKDKKKEKSPTPEKEESSHPRKSKKVKSRSKSPSKKTSKKKTRGRSKSVSKSRSRSRSPRSRKNRDSRDRKRNKSESSTKDSKRKKEKKKASSSEERQKKKEDEKIELEKREKAKKKAKEAGGVKSSVVIPEKNKDKVPKPTSNLIIRAINDSSGSSSSKKISLTRSITVTAGGTTSATAATLETKREKTATKRKSKTGTEENGTEPNKRNKTEKSKKNKENDKRVFVTKDQEGNAVELEKPLKTKKTTTANSNNQLSTANSIAMKTGQSGGRAASPKFFVTLHDAPNSKKDNGPKKKIDKDPKEMIINPDESDDSDTVPENDIAALSAARIKAQHDANNAQLQINTILQTPQQSVSLNVSSLAESDPDARTIFVSGLDWTVGEPELQEHFGIIGHIIRITVLKDRFTGCSKGCAYIQYATVEQKKTACEAFDKTDFHSRKISVGDKKPPAEISNYIARAAITANMPQKPAFPRPAKESKYSYVPGGPAAARSKYQWTKPGFMPPR